MAIELSLDAVDELAQDDYADIVIPLPSGQAVTLVHPLRMEDEQRKALETYMKRLGEEAEAAKAAKARAEAGEEVDEEAEGSEEQPDDIEQAQELIRIVSTGDTDELFERLGRDSTRYQSIVGFYFEKVTPGEA